MKKYTFLKDKNAIVESDWYYSYDGGGIAGVISYEAPVSSDMVGKYACDAVYAWEYFLIPTNDNGNTETNL